jgi:endonuclease/exonuclease/phosphatase family metal-dependent hydrolase
MKVSRFASMTALVWLLSVAIALGAEPALKLRVAAANITSGNKQSYDPGHGIRIFQATRPDVVAIQEMNYGDNSPAAMRKFVDEAFGTNFSYYREESEKKLNIPNGIISRYPIVKSGRWADPLPNIRDRGFAWAQIRLPNGQMLWVVSVHLSTKSAGMRQTELTELLRLIQANVPKGALLVIAGDTNVKSKNETSLDILEPVVGEKHKPEDGFGNTATNKNRNYPYDRILTSRELDAFHIPLELVIDRDEKSVFPEGLVFDTRRLTKLPPPALADDSDALNMQHMLILRDFQLPGALPRECPEDVCPVEAPRPVDATTH